MAEADDSDLEAENKRLREELKAAREELYWAGQQNEFLEKVSGFFAAKNQPKRGSKCSTSSQ